jgi:hypothetical protein
MKKKALALSRALDKPWYPASDYGMTMTIKVTNHYTVGGMAFMPPLFRITL